MYTLETIHAINNRPRTRRDNFNRDSSACFSRGGVVIHSGIHRSTLFLHSEEAIDTCKAWKRKGQRALNAYIEGYLESDTLEGANRNAFQRTFRGWTLQQGKDTKNPAQGALRFRAVKAGRLPVYISALTLDELIRKTTKQYKPCHA